MFFIGLENRYVNEKYSTSYQVAREKLNHTYTLSRAYKNISKSILSYSFQEKISKCLSGEIHGELTLSRIFMS